jgi:cell division protease FtsH
VLQIFAPIRERESRGSYTGTGKRLPSDRPPVLSPKEMALNGTENGALPGPGSGNGAYGSSIDGPSAIGGPGPLGPGAPMTEHPRDDGLPGELH